MNINVQFKHNDSNIKYFKAENFGFKISKLFKGPRVAEYEDDVLAIINDEVCEMNDDSSLFFDNFSIISKNLYKDNVTILYGYVKSKTVEYDIKDLNFNGPALSSISSFMEHIRKRITDDYRASHFSLGLKRDKDIDFCYDEDEKQLKDIFKQVSRTIKIAEWNKL